MKRNLLSRVFLVGAAPQACSCSSADRGVTLVDCGASYNDLVAELQGDSHGSNESPYYKAGLLERAERLLEQCPDHVGLKVLMANFQVSQGKNVAAMGYVTEALQIDPDNAQAIHTKGMIMSLVGKAEESLQLIRRSVELEPENVTFLINFCSTLELFGRYEEAIEVCSSVVKVDNPPPAAFYIRGRAYDATGQKENAQQDYDKAKQLGFDLPPM